VATRRVITGVLDNFLGTYVSRNSDFDGYLLFGFLVADLGELRIDLLGQPAEDPRTPAGAAAATAVARFDDQRRKAGLRLSQVHEAWLTIRRLPGPVSGEVNGRPRAGFNVRFAAAAVADNGRRYDRARVAFVAPHDAAAELRSARSH